MKARFTPTVGSVRTLEKPKRKDFKMSFVGARWWKFDFHTHTPASFDYGKGDTNLRSSKSHKDWLLDYIAKGIECVAVTDHNTGEWIDGVKAAAETLRSEGYSIYVFPGVEITANSNIHILGIFDPKWALFPKSGNYPATW